MRQVTLPVEFQGLQGKVNYVQQVSRIEFSSSCPQCGGVPHKNGEFPDRFRMWTNANGKNKVLGWCRHCSYVWFPDSDKPISKEDIEKWRGEQIRREEERKREAEQALKSLRSERIWERYHMAMTEWSWAVVKEWGVHEDYAKYWQLGFIPDYTVYRKNQEPYHSPGVSIPVWQSDGSVANVKVRVLNPKETTDRYRSLYKTGTGMPFIAFPELKSDTALVVEGEKKAMVCGQWSEQKYQTVGVPTKTPSTQSLSVLDSFGKVIICLDPDARIKPENGTSALRRMIEMVGKERVLVLNLPDKVDDMIVKYGLNINDAMRYAKEVA